MYFLVTCNPFLLVRVDIGKSTPECLHVADPGSDHFVSERMENETKMQQFLLLAKNAKGLALVDLIAKACGEPGLYSFGEILSLSNLQEVGCQVLKSAMHAAKEPAPCFLYWRMDCCHDHPAMQLICLCTFPVPCCCV
jgi:hypothetical protein